MEKLQGRINRDQQYVRCPACAGRLMIFPMFEPGVHTRATYPDTSIHEKVRDVGLNAGMYVLDLLDTFIAEGKDFRQWHAFAVDPHPNKEAHALAGRALAQFILSHRLIPKP